MYMGNDQINNKLENEKDCGNQEVKGNYSEK